MISVILTILFSAGAALYDARLLRSGRRINNHTPRFLFRALAVFLITLIFSKYKNDRLYNFLMVLLNSSIFYLLFDYILNWSWGKKIFRIGTTAVIDKIWNALGGSWPQLIFKVILVHALVFVVVKHTKSKATKSPKITQSYVGYA